MSIVIDDINICLDILINLTYYTVLSLLNLNVCS